jgi:hypothetical protein
MTKDEEDDVQRNDTQTIPDLLNYDDGVSEHVDEDNDANNDEYDDKDDTDNDCFDDGRDDDHHCAYNALAYFHLELPFP